MNWLSLLAELIRRVLGRVDERRRRQRDRDEAELAFRRRMDANESASAEDLIRRNTKNG